MFEGRLLRLEVQRWGDHDREVVRHPGAAGILALTGNGEVLLVRQFREAVGESTLEIPAGILDVEGEASAGAAARELREETGYRATAVERLGFVYTSPGFTDERIDLFIAPAEPSGEPEAGMEVVRIPLPEAVAAVLDGLITDAKTALGILWAARRQR